MKGCVNSVLRACLLVGPLAATPAYAATVAVGSCLPNRVSFDSISDAVQGVPPGSTIQVCPGIYREQVVIDKPMTIKGVASGNSSNPVIALPAGGAVANAAALNAGPSFFGTGQLIAAQVYVQAGLDVTITDISIDGAGASMAVCNNPVLVGVLVQDSSLTLNRIAIRNQLQLTPVVCGNVGVLAQNDSLNPTLVKVQNSTFVDAGQAYEGDGASLTSMLTSSSFAGNPANNANAVSILTGNSTVQANTISNYRYPPAANDVNGAAYGIFLTCVPGGTIANNTIATTQAGIFLSNPNCPTAGVSITNNKVSDAEVIGIDVGQTNGLVQGNDIRTSRTAIRIPGAAAGNIIQNNLINDACAAIGSNPAAGANTLLGNTISNVLNLSLVNTTALCP